MVKYYHDEKSSEDQFLGHKKYILANYNYTLPESLNTGGYHKKT